MDLFDLAAKLTIDTHDFEKGIRSASDKSDDFADRMKELQTEYNKATANVKVLQKALDDYTAETGEATGAGEDLAAMLADAQMAADKAKEEMDRLADEEDDVGNNAETAEKKTNKLATALKNAAKVGAAAFAAVTTASVAAVGALGKAIMDVASYGDEIDKMSQKMGISAQAYQEWDAVMKHSGTSMETLKSSMKTLATAAESGNDAFAQLGLTQSQIAGMDQEQLFSATISALQNVEDSTERTYLAGKLLGRGATELGALLNMSADETDAMKQRVHELGGVMSDDAVKAAAQFQDNLQDLKTAFGGLKRQMVAEFLPGVNDVLAGFTSLMIGEEGAEEKLSGGLKNVLHEAMNLAPKIGSLVQSLLPAILSALPEVISAGVEIVKGLGSALSDNADLLIGAVFDVIDVIVEYLGDPDGLMQLVDTTLVIIEKIAEGLEENLPTLIPAIVDIILKIVEKLTDPESFNELLNAALGIIMALVEGIGAALPEIVAKAPEIITNLVLGIAGALTQITLAAGDIILTLIDGIVASFDNLIANGGEVVSKIGEGIKQKFEDAKNWGKDMISNFVNGIKEKWENLKSKITGIADFVKGIFGHSHPKFGPMKDDYKWMPDMMDSFTKGIADNENKFKRTAAQALDLSGAVTMPDARGTVSINGSNADLTAMLRQYLPMIANRDIVLDSGELVGSLAYKMDGALGARTAYAARGMA